MSHLSGPLAEFLGNSLGIAAVMLVAGWLAIRWQQDRHRFALMQTALEKGITRFPDTPPYWLVSMRQALTMLSLGIALAVVGGGAVWVGHQTPTPSGADLQLQAPAALERDPIPDRRPQSLREDENARPRFDRSPDARPEPDGPPRRPPPLPNPQMERWHQAQAEQAAGQVSIGIGIILIFVGVVRMVFARTERKYTLAATSQDSSL